MNTSLGLLQSVGIGFAAIVLLAVVAVILFILTSAVKVLKEYERGVIFRLGRVQGRAKGPGLFILIPLVDKMVRRRRSERDPEWGT
jgi:regulator of protease activity HflC (stomatin/prohibitin superfamily)